MSNGITAPFFLQHFTDPTSGKPISGGTVEYYVGGSTNIPKLVYADITLSDSLGNVLTLDAGGYAPQYYMLSGYYKIVLRRANGAIVYTRDYVEGGANSSNGDHKFAINQADEDAGGAGYFQDKVVDSLAIEWEVVDVGDGVLQTKANLTDDATAKPIGPAGGDLFGTYPNPRVKELTGVPAMLTPSVASFNWKNSGAWASGAGIGYGYGYVNGVKSKVWMAISQLGELQVSYDEWKSTVYIPEGMPYRNSFTDYDGNTQLYNDVYSKFSGRYAAVSYMAIPGTGKNCWIFGAEGALFGLEDTVDNFYANGSPKLENMFAWSYSGSDPNSINSNGTVMVFTGNSSTITYAEAADINWSTKTISGKSATITGANASSRGVMGGNGCDGSIFMAVGRDSGIVVQSSNGKDWTVVDVMSNKFQDGTDMTKTSVNEYSNALPMNTTAGYTPAWGTNGNAWGGMLYANDMWIVVNGKPAPSTINTAWSPFMFSYDKSNWNGYMPTADELAVNYSYSMYKIAYGYGKTFATNSDPFQDYKNQPPIYRLLMDEIPAHRKLVAEKGMDVIGTLALLDLPNAEALGTDEDGNVIAVPGTSASIGDAPKTDYVFSPFPWATRKWIPNGKASGPVEAVMGDLVIDEVAHTITVPAYTVQLFDNINFLGQPLRYNVAQTTFTLTTANVRQFVVAKYISPGVAQTILTPFIEDMDMSQAFPLFSVERVVYSDGTSKIHSIGFDTLGEGLAQKIEIAHLRVEPYRRSKEGGLDISSTSLNLSLTASLVFAGTTPQNILAYSSASGDALVHAYKVAGVWTYTAETGHTFNNTQYQGTADLVTLGNNKYKCVWFFRSIGDDKEVYYVDGTAEYNTASDAQAEKVPTIPSLVNWHCLLVGRVIIQKSATSGYIVQSAFDNTFVGSGAASSTAAGGDLSGFYPSPLVDELSGSGNSFRVVTNLNADGSGSFIPDSDPFAHYSMAIKSEAGLAMFINLSNDVYFSKNGGLNWTFLYNLGGGSGMDITYGRISTGVYGWAICGQNQIIWFEDLSGNYDSNGLPLLSAWKSKSRASSDWADIANNSNTGDWFFALEAAGVFYSSSLSTSMTFTQVIPQGATGTEGGIFVDQTNNRIVYFEKLTGRVWWASGSSYANPTDWTEVLLNGVPVLKAVYPQMGVSGKGVGAGVECKNVCTFVGDVTIYATNVTDSSTYQRATSTADLPKLWNVCTDGVNVFGTRDDWSWSGIYPYKVIFQLYNDVIPAHKTFVAEKDLVVLGNEYIPNLPNCSSLATDANGKIIAGTGGGGGATLTGGFFPTMDIASATDRVLPYLNGTRSELLVLAAPRVGYKITQGTTTKFGIAVLQGGTGTIILTIRDVNMNLIAQSYVKTNPSSNVLLDIDCGVVYDPSTGLSVSSYQLTAGTPYYIGVNYSVTGAAYWGVVASETVNIQPVPAIRFDNLTDVPQTLVIGNGSESIIRPYIRLKG